MGKLDESVPLTLFVGLHAWFVACTPGLLLAPLVCGLRPWFAARTHWFVGCTHWFVGCTHWFVGCTHWFVGCTHWFVGCTHWFVRCTPLFVRCTPLFVGCTQLIVVFFLCVTESVKEGTHKKSRKGATAVACGIGPRRGHHARKAHSQKNSVTTGAPKVMLHEPSLPRTSTSQPTFSATRPPRWPSTIPTLPELCAEPAMRRSSLFQKTTVLRPHLRRQRVWYAPLLPPVRL